MAIVVWPLRHEFGYVEQRCQMYSLQSLVIWPGTFVPSPDAVAEFPVVTNSTGKSQGTNSPSDDMGRSPARALPVVMGHPPRLLLGLPPWEILPPQQEPQLFNWSSGCCGKASAYGAAGTISRRASVQPTDT